MINSTEPMGIYIHVPFCLHKCGYCDFYSVALSDPHIMDQYIQCLINEIKQRQGEFSNPFASIYLGGGTPSLLKPGHLEKLLDSIFAQFKCWGEPEISMEVNPATVNLQRLKEFRSVGINRLSVGVQSFADSDLKVLGRIHDAREAKEVLELIARAGFFNYNLDLIYGVPGQKAADWENNLKTALSFNPQHVSVYLLQLEPSTPMAQLINSGELTLLDDDMEASLYDLARTLLQAQGYEHYEISNFAQPGKECRHNLQYWQGHKYLGLGAGAVSFDGVVRLLNKPPVDQYIERMLSKQARYFEVLETMDAGQQAVDAIIMGLRLVKGISRQDFLDRFEIDIFSAYRDTIAVCREQGLLVQEQDRLYLTPQAFFLSNQVLSRFLG